MWNLTRPVVTPCAESQNYLYLGCPWIDKQNVLVRNRVSSNCLLSLKLRLRKFFFYLLTRNLLSSGGIYCSSTNYVV